LSHNQIEDYDLKKDLPKNIQIMRMNDNPVEKADPRRYRE